MKWFAAVGGIVLLALGIGFAVWWYWPRPVGPCDLASYAEPSRDALLIPRDVFGDHAETVVYLDQGWSPRDSMDFYTRTQGSRLVPCSWFLALEQPANEQPFRDPANISRLRYLPQKPNACNPDGLPVGFVKDPVRPGGQEDWLGLNCAACHTTQINYQNTAYRIDGGPTMGDQETLLNELTLALKNTLDDPAKFERFATKVLRKGHAAQDKADLREQLGNVSRFRAAFDARNRPDHPYGFARLDAFGRILNEVLVNDLRVTDESQRQVPNAPVSYPFLWDTPHHDFVQWNAIAANNLFGSRTIGGLARNVGEVLGVFGEVVIPQAGSGGGLKGYDSSIRVADLVDTEKLVRKLQSPRWPKEFPPINEDSRRAGESLFSTYCVTCHAGIDRVDPDRTVKAVKTPLSQVRTDPQMARNFANRSGRTGSLEGRKRNFVVGPPFGAEASADEILVHTVVGVILNTPFDDYQESDLLRLRRPKVFAFDGTDSLNLVYKARPLNGIWATAPYLHNGSVASLYQLLLPAEERLSQFYVGQREFDPKNVGFQTAAFEGGFLFRTTDEQGKPIPGNSAAGHEYGTGKKREDGGDGLPALKPEERWQLIEYLKSL
jgi:hypothetical protein